MSQRRPVIAGNWKMHKTVAATRTLVAELSDLVVELATSDIAVAPPFTALAAGVEAASGSDLAVLAQNMHFENEGAFTGEISPEMLVDLGVDGVILGHSERRALFGEDDELIARKVRAALAQGLVPYLCVGETLEERKAGTTDTVVAGQLQAALEGLLAEELNGLVVAYEPVWAIGTGLTATPEQAQAVHATTRDLLVELFGLETAGATRIQYGGSVKPDNVVALLSCADIDGALVGGASLDAASFGAIVRGASR